MCVAGKLVVMSARNVYAAANLVTHWQMIVVSHVCECLRMIAGRVVPLTQLAWAI